MIMMIDFALALLLLPLSRSSPVPTQHAGPHSRSLPRAPHVLPLKRMAPSSGHQQRSSRSMPVPLVDWDFERNFLAPVSLGGQTVDLWVDTGSSNTWAVSAGYSCVTGSTCAFGRAITVTDQFEPIEQETFYTSYLDGTGGTGIVANASVSIDGITIPAQTIGLVNSLNFEGSYSMSGCLGLAYPALTSAMSGSVTVTYSSIMNTIFTEGLTDPLFSIAISRDTSQSGFGGYLTIGGIPDISDKSINSSTTYGSADILQNPADIVPGRLTSYIITVDGVSWSDGFGSSGAEDISPFLYMVDSGTTISHLPDTTAASINALFEPPATLNSDGIYVVSCNAIPPQLSITVGGVNLRINPIDLILRGRSTCYSGIQPLISKFPVGFIGDMMLRSLLAVFDWGEKKVHLASRPEYES